MIADEILSAFNLKADECHIAKFGAGLINHTYKIENNGRAFILQKINTFVFKYPGVNASNIRQVELYLKRNYPHALFPAPLPGRDGELLAVTKSGGYYRLLPFVNGSHTINAVENKKQAFEAARQFGKLSRLLNNFDSSQLEYTLPDFHNLSARFGQFETAYKNAAAERIAQSEFEIEAAYGHVEIEVAYRNLTVNKLIPLRVMHHDTKINNVLFDDEDNGLCVVDFDTLMPGYFFSDVGDMMRTYLSQANEEEINLDKIAIRTEIFGELYSGYMVEMDHILTETEKSNFLFAGKIMIYMQALRFLTDFLNNDVYYGSGYVGHNLNRAKNQFTLLNRYIQAMPGFERIINKAHGSQNG